mmetsp:Transcript_87439/g.283094  ORF Transcript_87439/g.283094 Transcript_87439/m.283094 type:complete len:264 (+) Transcript_87439:222-1013(+)
MRSQARCNCASKERHSRGSPCRPLGLLGCILHRPLTWLTGAFIPRATAKDVEVGIAGAATLHVPFGCGRKCRPLQHIAPAALPQSLCDGLAGAGAARGAQSGSRYGSAPRLDPPQTLARQAARGVRSVHQRACRTSPRCVLRSRPLPCRAILRRSAARSRLLCHGPLAHAPLTVAGRQHHHHTGGVGAAQSRPSQALAGCATLCARGVQQCACRTGPAACIPTGRLHDARWSRRAAASFHPGARVPTARAGLRQDSTGHAPQA